MPQTALFLGFENINVSAQIGDIVYYSHSGNPMGGFNSTDLANTVKLGPITEIHNETLNPITLAKGITLIYNSDPPHPGPPGVGAFISFIKDPVANKASLVGYFASVNFVNNSTDKVELFSIGSEISESSK